MEYLIHFDKYISQIMQACGPWIYILLFVIIFCETGLIVLPFLPGDSLLFVIGALATGNSINAWMACAVMILAAAAGDTVNYQIGKAMGQKLFNKEKVRFFNKKQLIRAHNFYEKHGGKTIFLARFIPVIRTFAPFVAGMGKMRYLRFVIFNIAGAVSWVSLFVAAGYFFDHIPFVKDNFAYVIFFNLTITAIPVTWAFIREKCKKRNPGKKPELDRSGDGKEVSS